MSLYSFPEKDHRVHLKTICTINKSKGFRLRSYHFLHTFHELIHPCSSRRRQSADVVMKQSWPFQSRAARDDWGKSCHIVPSGLHGIMSPNWVLVKSRLFSRLNREASTHCSHSLTRAGFWKINFTSGEWGQRGGNTLCAVMQFEGKDSDRHYESCPCRREGREQLLLH